MTEPANVTVSYNITTAAQATGMSDATLRAAIARGDLIAHYPTVRPLILAEDLRAWIAAAPTDGARR